jgi:hypothetical protein
MEVSGWPPENIEEFAKKYEDPYWFSILFNSYKLGLNKQLDHRVKIKLIFTYMSLLELGFTLNI